MELTKFFDAVEEKPCLKGAYICNTSENGVVFGVENTKLNSLTELSAHAIENTSEGDLFAVLTGDREPEVLHHLTRVVGYYSRTSNWNPSKLGELRDRQKGDYAVGGE